VTPIIAFLVNVPRVVIQLRRSVSFTPI